MIFRLKNCFILLLAASYCHAQSWERIEAVSNIQQSGPLLNGYFKGDTSVIISAGGYIIKSKDFYSSYQIDSSFNHTQFTDISFANDKVGYILAPSEHGGVIKSSDGGLNWEPIYESMYTTADWGDRLTFFDSETAICTQYSSNSFYVTTDSGVTWVDKSVSNFGCERILRSEAINDSTIYILCTDQPLVIPTGDLRLLKSANRGQSWVEMSLLALTGNVDISAINDTTFFLVTKNLVIKSTDELHSFDTVLVTNSVDNSIGLNSRSVSFINKDTGFIAFGRSIYKTLDGGLNWIKTDFQFNPDETDNGIVFIKAITSHRVVLGCYNGNIYKTETGGGIWTGIEDVEKETSLFIYPNPVNEKLTCSFLSTNAVYTVSNIQGAIVIPATVPTREKFDIDVSHLSSGIYYLTVYDDKKRYVKKFVKQ